METLLQVLSENEKTQVHERSLKILAETGVRVDTAKGRQYLKDAGAEVDENTKIVRTPRALVEESLRRREVAAARQRLAAHSAEEGEEEASNRAMETAANRAALLLFFAGGGACSSA